MKNINELWEQVINKELSIEEIDKLSIEKVREYDNLFICLLFCSNGRTCRFKTSIRYKLY